MVWIDYASSFDKICEGGKHKTHLCIPLRQGTARDWRGVPKFMDEPTAGLDVVARDEILELLRSFMERDAERSILISSHISSDLESLCDDIYMIDGGKIIMHEDADVLLDEYALLKLSERQYADMDKQYILKRKKENYGYCCLTNQKRYYMENYPGIAVEKGSIDNVITMMIRGE